MIFCFQAVESARKSSMVDVGRRADVEVLVQAALDAVDPERLVREFLASFDFSPFEKIFVLGAGKAGGSMALGVEKAMRAAVKADASDPKRGSRGMGPDGLITEGVAVVKDGHMVEGLERVRQVEAAHPVPDGRGVDAARTLLDLAGRAGEDDLVLCLISGGASALTALPAPGLSLKDLQQTVAVLLRSGAEIADVNAIRKHLTMASAGRLAEASYPAKVIALIISDVIGDTLDVIASGPTVPDESSFIDALTVLQRYGLEEKVPPAVSARLRAGAAGEVEETPKPGAEIFSRVENHILASNRTALKAAAVAAEGLAYSVLYLEEPVTGEARDEAKRLVAKALACESDCILAGGETTVSVAGGGTGGRAQEFALAAALAIEGLDDMLVFAFGTDGTDGFTDAAGAMADSSTVSRARALGPDARRHLHDNDSFPLFSALGDLIITGPTGTNVNDIYGVLIRT